jgi:hypothetical protein
VPKENGYHIFALISKDKFNTFDDKDIIALKNQSCVNIYDVKIKNPNNPAKIIDGVLIKIEL